ncbi:LytR/AlgR family response regulator transcription factor [Clostridium paraputrificum]|uniref:LytR/AlgR family response regulator transcription factor n=1 Tax=Clostridium paraputrificum TaxID=29363 RepID=UPI003D324EBF
MISIGVCDDEKISFEIIKGFLKKYNLKVNVTYFNSGYDLLKKINELDLIFLDICMPEINGISVANIIRVNNNPIPIIFLTCLTDRIQDGYKVSAFRFLIKPLEWDTFKSVMDDYQSKYLYNHNIIINEERFKIKISENKIMYIECIGDKTAIHTEEDIYLSNKTIKQWNEELDKRKFVNCHKSFIVNLYYVKSWCDVIMLNSGQEVLVSRRKKKEFETAIYNYIKYF